VRHDQDAAVAAATVALGHRGPHRLQHLLSRTVWDDQQVLDTAAAWAAGHLDDGDAVLIVDETADEKSSADAVGAARQYSGTVGGVALCQVAVTLTFATGRGHALIGRALYLPEGCAADEEHRELPGLIPVTVPELLRLLRDVVIPPPRRDRAHRLHWSEWRRRHQHRARQAHQRWNAYAETAS
jgi:SRSO17 transposase